MEGAGPGISAEVSIYPIESPDADAVIRQCVQEFQKVGLQYQVDEVSTHCHGNPDQLWKGLQAAYHRALTLGGGEVSMVVTLTNGKR